LLTHGAACFTGGITGCGQDDGQGQQECGDKLDFHDGGYLFTNGLIARLLSGLKIRKAFLIHL